MNFFFDCAFKELDKADNPRGLYGLGMAILALAKEQERTADAQERIADQQNLKALEEEHLMAIEALEAFVEAWDKSLQLEKTDVALRLAKAVLELAKERQNE